MHGRSGKLVSAGAGKFREMTAHGLVRLFHDDSGIMVADLMRLIE